MRLRSGRMPRIERRVDTDVTPAGIETAVGAAGVVVATIVAACLPVRVGDWRLMPVAVALLVTGAWVRHVRVLALVAVSAALMVDGFLVNRLGELTWDGTADAYRLSVAAGSAGLGLLLGALYRRWHRPPPLTVPSGWTAERGRRTASRKNKEESPRG
jgi:hypothetical protein